MRQPQHAPRFVIGLMSAVGFWLFGSGVSLADEPVQGAEAGPGTEAPVHGEFVPGAHAPLQGKVEEAEVIPDASAPPAMEPMPVPVAAPQPRKPLEGKLEQNELQGGAQGTGLTGSVEGGAPGVGLTGGVEGGGWAGNAQQGTLDQSRPTPLQGGAAQNPLALGVQNDPDAADQELQIEWDLWRNTLMQAIQAGTVAKINVQNDINFVLDPGKQMMVSRYPNGISTWYSLDVLPDRRIIHIRLVSSSRYQGYDQAVMQAISDLQGNNILTYPNRSKRRIVTQQSCVSTAPVSQNQQFQFGDVERQRY